MSGTSFNQRYTLIRELGRGGFSVTWLAQARGESQSQYLVKELLLDRVDDWKAVEQFEREARVLSHLDHAGIPDFYDFIKEDGEQGKRLFLVQELIQGSDLESLIQGGKYFTEKEVIEIGLEIAEVLVYLHRFSPPIIHQDIKPSNIMLKGNKVDSAYLIDFGAIKGPPQEGSSGMTVTGTFGYMPLEQIEGAAVPASDIYALGMSLLYLLSHQEPTRLPKKGLKVDFRPHVNISEPFAAVLDRMIDPDVSQRYQQAETVRQALQQQLRAPAGASAPALAQPAGAVPGAQAANYKPWLVAAGVLGLLGWFILRDAPEEKPTATANPASQTTAASGKQSVNALADKSLADDHYQASRYKEAVVAYTRYLAAYPNDAEALFRRGYSHSELSEHSQAVQDFLRVLELNPAGYTNVHYNLGYNYFELAQYSEAMRHLQDQLKQTPGDNATLNYIGLVQREQQQYAEAEATFKKVLAQDPGYKYAHNNLGTIYRLQQKHPEALAAFDKAIAADPSYALPYYNKASLYYNTKRPTECVQVIAQALQQNTGYTSAYNLQGLCQRELKQHDNAIFSFSKAFDLDPGYSAAAYNRALTHDDLEQFEQAESWYLKAIALNPTYASALNNLAHVYQRQQKYPEAIDLYNRAIAAKPSAMYYNNRGDTYKAWARCSEAKADWQLACSNGNTAACKKTC